MCDMLCAALPGVHRELQALLQKQQQQQEAAGEFAVAPSAASNQSAVEWSMLVGGRPAYDTTQRISSSSKSLLRTVTRRSLAGCDSFSAASTRQLATNLNASSRDGADVAPAELLQAYRRMPALRVRFTPEHFASMVSAVAGEWNGVEPNGATARGMVRH